MFPRLTCCRGLAIAAGLVWLLPATAARAQYSMGYDSYVYGTPPPQTFWAGEGYQSMYTEPATGVYANGTLVPDRTVAPYNIPPYGQFSRFNGLPRVAPRPPLVVAPPATAEAAPVAQPVVRARRGLLRRKR